MRGTDKDVASNIDCPVLAFDDADLHVFASIDAAAGYIEPWDIDDGIWQVFDASGQLLSLGTGPLETTGRWTGRRKTTEWTIILATGEWDQGQLSSLLCGYVRTVGVERLSMTTQQLGRLSLTELVEVVVGAMAHDR